MTDRAGMSAARGEARAIGLAVAMESRLLGEALVAMLSAQADFHVAGPVLTCEAALALCGAVRPAVLLLGILAGWPRERPALPAIGAVSPATRVLVVAPHGRDRCAHLNPFDDDPTLPWTRHSTCLPRALALGAHGVVSGDATPETLYAAVRALARGGRWPARAPAREAVAAESLLSRQEVRIARLIGRGASNKEIGSSLAISELTVKKHVGRIFRKLGVHDRLQLGLCVARNPAVLDRERDRR